MDNDIKKQIHSNTEMYMNCFMLLVKDIYENNNLPPELLFSLRWGFEYNEQESHIWDRVALKFPETYEEFSKKHIGLEVELYKNDPFKALNVIEKNNYNENRIIIELNAYYCPWNLSYNKNNLLHFCVVINIEKQKKIIYCKDPYVSNKTYGWDYELFLKAYINLRIVNLNSRISKVNYNDFYGYLISGYKNGYNEMKEKYAVFSRDILQVSQIEQLFDSDVVDVCTLLIKLKQISKDRMGIAGMLIILEGVLNNKTDLYDQIYKTSILWQDIVMLLLKMFFRKKVKQSVLEKISLILMEIMKIDEDFYKKIKKYENTLSYNGKR